LAGVAQIFFAAVLVGFGRTYSIRKTDIFRGP
jgi:hypothetical protein